MKLETWLKQATQKLSDEGIGTARLDVLVLLEDELNTNRAQLIGRPETKLTPEQIKKLAEQIRRRTAHEPLAYIRGRTDFYGREFIIDKNVLEPRPESETMIDMLKELYKSKFKGRKICIADVGAGSGALGITAKLELPNADVDLIEIDKNAIKTAQKNVIKLSTSTSVIESNLLESAPNRYDILLCNLPYVPDNFQINPAAMREPKIAIFGGHDGLDIYRRLFEQLINSKNIPLYILSESLPPQHQQLQALAQSAGYRLVQTEDFIQCFEQSV